MTVDFVVVVESVCVIGDPCVLEYAVVTSVVRQTDKKFDYFFLGLRTDCAGPSGGWPAEIVSSNPTGGMDVCCECCVLSGIGLCDELITRPEESN
jgi:hypothetical protein